MQATMLKYKADKGALTFLLSLFLTFRFCALKHVFWYMLLNGPFDQSFYLEGREHHETCSTSKQTGGVLPLPPATTN